MNNGIFEGGFRRLPEQNLAGASKHSRKGDFLEKIQWERANRQIEVKKKWSATVIQSLVRGFLVRRRMRRIRETELINAALSPISLSFHELGHYMTSYCFLENYHSPEILDWLIDTVLNHRDAIIRELLYDNSPWLWRVKWFMRVNINRIGFCLENSTPENPSNIKNNMLLLDNFTSYGLYSEAMGDHWATITLKEINLYMLTNKYFFVLKNMLFFDFHLAIGILQKSMVNSHVEEHLKRMLRLICNSDEDYAKTVVKEYSKYFLTNRTTEDAKIIIMETILEFNIDAIKTLVNGIINGEISPSTMCFHVMIECFKRGCFFVTRGLLFGRSLEAFAVLLKNSAYYCPKVKHHQFFDDEPMASDSNDIDDDSDEEEENDSSVAQKRAPLPSINKEMLNEALTFVKSIEFAVSVLNFLGSGYNVEILSHLSKFVHVVVSKHPYMQFKILWYAPLHGTLYRDLWIYLYSLQRREGQTGVSLLTLVSKGAFLTAHEAGLFFPTLITFCLIFKRHISMHNYGGLSELELPFPLPRMIEISIRLRDLAFTILKAGMPEKPLLLTTDIEEYNFKLMKDSYKPILNLLRLLHAREIGPDLSYWESKKMFVYPGVPVFNDTNLLARHEPFNDVTLTDRLITGSNNLTRSFMILRDLPYAIPIHQRMGLLQELFALLKANFQSPQDFVNDNTFIKVRRDYIYEDAFDKLSDFEMPDIRGHIRIQLISAIGYEEAGVDGGGIFREFMNEFLRSAFDPNRGFFLVNQERMLYPNPNVEVLYNNFRKHYFFIGRMLAKALFEGILLDLPIADFFLSSLIKRDRDVNLSDLYSLDPLLHKNLISLLNYEGDITTLGLNYTSVADLYGQTAVTELIPGGEKICVNKINKIDYVQIVADYKLNVQIEPQCNYFRQGMGSVFSIYWLAMFSAKELQRSVFCSDTPINVKDLRSHCYYSGGYTCSHPNIIRFWRVFSTFDDAERKLLLKFVTSCSRQPLLGFKDLDPPFTIQLVENSNRLPTSSTCMNLLKLPLFKDENVMKEKLLISIHSQAGFDLC